MGNHSPHPLILDTDYEEAIQTVIEPMTKAMIKEGIPFTGNFICRVNENSPMELMSLNLIARFGDPETEVLLPRLETELTDIMLSLLDGKDIDWCWSDQPTVGVVLAAKGYPGSYVKGTVIKGLETLEGVDICSHGNEFSRRKDHIKWWTRLICCWSGET